jgi:hypothetical protein
MYLNPFDGARAKIVRAHKHTLELIAAERQYSAEQPLAVTLVPQANGDTMVVAAIAALPPLEHRAIVADIIGNFRAALDIATVQACIVRGQTDSKLLGKTYFAFAGDENDWWGNVNAKYSRMAGADTVVRQTVASFKPWGKDGNALLYAMSKLASDDKHTDLVPVAASAAELEIASLSVKREDGKAAGISAKVPQWGDHGPVELLTVLGPAKVEISGPVVLKASFGFGDVAGIKGKPVIPTLNQMGVMCQEIIQALELAAKS